MVRGLIWFVFECCLCVCFMFVFFDDYIKSFLAEMGNVTLFFLLCVLCLCKSEESPDLDKSCRTWRAF